MGEEIKILAVEAVNGGTSIQIDCDKGRLFVGTRDILKALNNEIYTSFDRALQAQGWQKEDPSAPIPNLIV